MVALPGGLLAFLVSTDCLRSLESWPPFIEKNIHELIEDNKDVHNSYELVTSVVGSGFATAVHFIIATENFTRFENVRELICYCGVAPFKHGSGTSIRGQTWVSPLLQSVMILSNEFLRSKVLLQ
jgi:hypothetical protein